MPKTKLAHGVVGLHSGYPPEYSLLKETGL